VKTYHLAPLSLRKSDYYVGYVTCAFINGNNRTLHGAIQWYLLHTFFELNRYSSGHGVYIVVCVISVLLRGVSYITSLHVNLNGERV